jgi:hypothetical protein
MPGVSLEKLACQETGLIPPGRPPFGTRKANPVIKGSAPAWLDGIIDTQEFDAASKDVEAEVAVGLNVIRASGVAKLKSWPFEVKVMTELVMDRVTGWLPTPLTFMWLLNQIVLPP